MPKGPHGLTHRQERFCRAFARGLSASRAAVAAGYRSAWCGSNGYRLLRHPRIRARIAAIQAETGREFCDGADALLGKMETVFRAALDDRNYAAAARIVEMQARLALRFGRAVPEPAALSGQAADSQGKSGKMTENDSAFREKSGRNGYPRFFLSTCEITRKPKPRHFDGRPER